MAFVDLEDARIHYDLSGPASASTLVLSNSLGTDFSMWNPQVPQFRKRWGLLRYDTRGHGKSSIAPGPYTIEQLARDVLGLLDALRLDRVHFCGLSLGGMIGMWLGRNAPHRLLKLVLCSTAAKIGTPEVWKTRIETVRAGGMKAVAPAVMERWFTSSYRRRAPKAIASIQSMIESTSSDGYIACSEAVRDFDEREKISAIRVPTLVISGRHDPATTPADGRYLVEHIPGAQYVELDAAHLSNIEDRDNFNKQVVAFLSC